MRDPGNEVVCDQIGMFELKNCVLEMSSAKYHVDFRRSNFCKDHRDKIEVPDPLVVEDLISDNLNYWMFGKVAGTFEVMNRIMKLDNRKSP